MLLQCATASATVQDCATALPQIRVRKLALLHPQRPGDRAEAEATAAEPVSWMGSKAQAEVMEVLRALKAPGGGAALNEMQLSVLEASTKRTLTLMQVCPPTIICDVRRFDGDVPLYCSTAAGPCRPCSLWGAGLGHGVRRLQRVAGPPPSAIPRRRARRGQARPARWPPRFPCS